MNRNADDFFTTADGVLTDWTGSPDSMNTALRDGEAAAAAAAAVVKRFAEAALAVDFGPLIRAANQFRKHARVYAVGLGPEKH